MVKEVAGRPVLGVHDHPRYTESTESPVLPEHFCEQVLVRSDASRDHSSGDL